MLRATTACTFLTSQLPKVVRTWCVLYNGVQFFISHLASWLRIRRFSEPTFRPSRATNHWKNTVNRDFPTFSRICIFFLLIFSLLTLLTSAFQLSILSEVSLLNFLRLDSVCGVVRKWPYQHLDIQGDQACAVVPKANVLDSVLDSISWNMFDNCVPTLFGSDQQLHRKANRTLGFTLASS